MLLIPALKERKTVRDVTVGSGRGAHCDWIWDTWARIPQVLVLSSGLMTSDCHIISENVFPPLSSLLSPCPPFPLAPAPAPFPLLPLPTPFLCQVGMIMI